MQVRNIEQMIDFLVNREKKTRKNKSKEVEWTIKKTFTCYFYLLYFL
jgi:hypothetical protein